MADTSSLKQRILVLGARGMVGTALTTAFAGPQLFTCSHQDLDITDYSAVEKTIFKIRPDLILNAAAFTRVDDCERLRETAYVVNAQAPGHLATLCKKNNVRLVHLSTDYIFDGKSTRPYAEDDIANPLNYYGVTKLEGEKRILASGCRFLIVRSSWIFGKSGDNFVKKILKRALAGARLQVPADQVGCPTYADHVAAAILRLLDCRADGIYHFAGNGSCSRHEQAQIILSLYGLNNPVEAAKNESLHVPARRPLFSVLDISRYRETTGHSPRSWQQSTAEYIAFLKQNENELRS